MLQEFRNRRDEFHVELRAEVWERLEAELSALPSRRVVVLRRFAVLAAAAAVVALLSLPLFFTSDRPAGDVVQAPPVPAAVGQPDLPAEPASVAVEPAPVAVAQMRPAADARRHPAIPVQTASLQPPDKQPPDGDTITTLPEEHQASENKNTRQYDGDARNDAHSAPAGKKTAVPSADEPFPKPTFIPKATPPSRPWTVAMNVGSNGLRSSATGAGTGQYSKNTNTAPSESSLQMLPKGDGPIVITTLAPEGGSEDTEYRHYLPLSIKFAVHKELGDGWTLGSGILYNYLYTEVLRHNVSNGTQKLHYLGLPLSISRQLFTAGSFDFYASAGGTIEYCLSAKRHIGRKVKDISLTRFQPSLNLTPGVQVTLFNSLSLFAEPGLSYYFNMNDALETFYTRRAATFNLQTGIRYTFN